jgi:hypothetical protein
MTLTPNQHAAVEQFAQSRYDDEMAYYREYRAEQLAKITPEQLAEYKEKLRSEAHQWVEIILDPDRMMERHSKGFLHPSNKNWRALFTAFTGVELPNTVAGTDAAFRKYIGHERYEAFLQGRRDEREAKEQQRLADKAAERQKRIDAIAAKVKQGEYVSGDDLVDLLRHLEIDIHPRTVGTLRKRVVEIKADQARIRGRGLPNGMYHLYQAAQLKLAG